MDEHGPDPSDRPASSSPTVLVVDDDQEMQKVLAAWLTDDGMKVTAAENGAVALAHIADSLPDIILVDARMPILDGFATCERIRALPAGTELPILMITAFDDAASVEQAFASGADDVLFKPLHLTLLTARLRHLMQARRQVLALRESEARFRDAFEQAGIGMALVTAQGQVRQVNRALCTLLDYPEDELIGRNFLLFTHPDDRFIGREEAQAAREGRLEHYQIEKRYLRKDSATIWCSVNVAVVRDREGSLDHVVSQIQDITARKEAADQLRQSQALLAEAQRITHLGTWKWVIPSNTVTWSDELYRIFGVTPQTFDATHEGFLGYVHPDDRSLVATTIDHTLVDHQPFRYRYRIVRPDGEVRAILDRGELVLDDQGRPWYTIGTAQDITERAQAVEMLRLRDQAIAATTNGIIVTDATTPDNPIMVVNPAFLQMTGYSEAEVLGRNCRFLQGAGTDPATVALLHDAITQGQSITIEILNYRKDGTTFWNQLSIAPMRDTWGRLTNFVGVQQDITARRQTDEMRHAKEVAEYANRAKSEFLSRMSHELRTPLSAILGFAQLLAMDHLNPDQSESVEHIVAGGHHLLKLIDEMLDITRIETGRMTLVVEALPIDEIVQEVLDLLQSLAHQQQIIVHCTQAVARQQFVLADRRRLMQVLLNIISNAIKYTPIGGKVTIHDRSAGEWLRVEISDTGHGIPQDKLPRLFSPFDRLEAEGSTIEGTGLGLALSKALVEEMGGTIGASSAVGQGSTFWFELPLAPGGEPHIRVEPVEEARTPAVTSKATMLYIDDDQASLKLVEHVLRLRPQIKLLVARQARAGLDLVHQHQPDAIVLDLNLPDLSGEMVLSELQKNPELQRIPVLMLSADAMPHREQQLLAAGAQAYLTKPLDLQRFLEIVDQMLAFHAGSTTKPPEQIRSGGFVA